MEFLPQGFYPLATLRQFVVYKLTPSTRRSGKNDKLPIHPQTLATHNAHDPAIWLSADEAIASAKALGAGYGVGFVFTENDPFWFLDIDDCLLPTNEWSPLSLELLKYFAGCAVEVSSSGKGLHIIGTGTPQPNHPCKNADLGIEFYSRGRFVALTGTHASGSADTNCQHLLDGFFERYFGKKTEARPAFTWTDHPVPEWNGSDDDEEILRRALQSKSGGAAFGSKASFRDLWEADANVLARAYPDPERDCGYDESSADAALAQHLAFWTGNNCERIRGLMTRSALNREKWNREDYLVRTIAGACTKQKEWLSDKPIQTITNGVPVDNAKSSEGVPESPKTSKVEPQRVTGSVFLTVDDQIKYFEGCVYVTDEHKVLIPGGRLVKPEQFKVLYGGCQFNMDLQNQRNTRNAWEAFSESQAFRAPRADSSCFKPRLAPGEIIQKDGQFLVNTWCPVQTPMEDGDVTRFWDFMKKLFPVERDRMIVFYYMCALVQYQGVKFQWCPLIQGVEGNGKSMLSRIVAFAIGDRYVHFPKAAELASRFNDWMYARTFIAVEDIYVVDGRLEVMEAMKPMITNEKLEIEPKGGAKVTREVCANFIINTNHKDGLRKNRNDRRFAPFYTGQQRVEDLERDGMTGDFFPDMYDWLNDRGFRFMNYLLSTTKIPDEYNPATACKRAPKTSSTDAAIAQGMGGIEQEVLEHIQQGAPGFREGWVSSITLATLLDRMNCSRRVPHARRNELMEALDYIPHPGLPNGRVRRNVLPDNGMPRLYVERNHATIHYTNEEAITKAYEDAQRSRER